MAKDGICRVHDNLYSKTIRFFDLNYQLAQAEDKDAIFEGWCEFLNYFDFTIHVQLSFVNHHSATLEFDLSLIHILKRFSPGVTESRKFPRRMVICSIPRPWK